MRPESTTERTYKRNVSRCTLQYLASDELSLNTVRRKVIHKKYRYRRPYIYKKYPRVRYKWELKGSVVRIRN